MEILNLTGNLYELPGVRLHDGETITIQDRRYLDDAAFRLEVNTLYANGKISVADAPDGFPILSAVEEEIASGERAGASSGGSQPFTPTDLTGLALWLDASDASTINAGSPADADPVSAWADKSGNGYNGAQATADNKPVYKTAILNGLPVVRFDPAATNRFLDFATAGPLLRNAPGVTIAAVLISRGTAETYWFAAGVAATQGNHRCVLGESLRVTQNQGTGINVYGVQSYWLTATNDDGNDQADTTADLNLYDDGVIPVPHAILTTINVTTGAVAALASESVGVNTIPRINPQGFSDTPGPFPDTDSYGVRLGQDIDNGAGFPATGDIGEFIVVGRALTLSERLDLLEYLSAKWATL